MFLREISRNFEMNMSADRTNIGDLTLLLQDYARGNQDAFRLLIERVYQELRQIAVYRLRAESRNPMMGPSALINEAYIRLVDGQESAKWENRRHFFGAASETMRRILIDQARQRMALKRGGNAFQQSIEGIEILTNVTDEDLVDIDAALNEFSRVDPLKADLVKMRFFAGFSEEETAEILGISRATASRNWTYAKAWLLDWLMSHDERENR